MEANGELVQSNQGTLMVKDDLKLMDVHVESGASAIITVSPSGEQYLTVNTSQAKTSCTLNLNLYHDIHGAVITEGVFATLKFSPDGR